MMSQLRFLIAGLIIGALLATGVLREYRSLRDQVASAENLRLGELLELPDRELLGHSDELKKLEDIRGKIFLSLLACLGSKVHTQETLAELEKKAEEIPKRRDEARFAAPGQPPLNARPRQGLQTSTPTPSPTPAPSSAASPESPPLSSGLHPSAPFSERDFFCQAVRGAPELVRTEGWEELIPSERTDLAVNTAQFGTTGTAGTAAAFLDSKACKTPRFWKLDEQQRKQNAFFQAIVGRVFQGRVTYLPPFNRDNYRPLTMHFHSNRRLRDPNREYWNIFKYDGRQESDILENRYAAYSTTPQFYRLNACSTAIAFLNDRCALLPGFDLEYIDWFFTGTGDRRLIGNIYCRKRSSTEWTRVAIAELRENSSSR